MKLIFITVFTISFTISGIQAESIAPLTLYVVTDAHVGRCDKGDDMMKFAEMCNANKPDIVLDLGDTIEGSSTEFYDYVTDRQAALAQQLDWLNAWNSINIEHKEVAFGNRDVREDYPLGDDDWIGVLGYEDRPKIGGTSLQNSFTVENDDVKAMVIVTSQYSETFDLDKTLEWVEEEVLGFDGDFIVFAAHNAGLYPHFRDMLIKNDVETSVLYLHGHNHGPDTLVRDAWGYEQMKLDFPSFLVTDLMCSGKGAKFRLYPGGHYEKFRLDVRNREISEPEMHYQTRVE